MNPNQNLTYALCGYNFLVEQGEKLSGKEYADRIRKTYSTENPHNAWAVALIETAVDWYECVNKYRGEFRVRINDNYYDMIVNQ